MIRSATSLPNNHCDLIEMSSVVIKKEDPDDGVAQQSNVANQNRSNRNPNIPVKQENQHQPQQQQQQQNQKKVIPYKDFPIYSSAPTTSLSHVMRFDSHLPVDPSSTTQFVRPLKLNRKREPRLKQKEAKGGEMVLDRWGKQLLEDGKPMVWPRDEKELKKIEAQLKAIDDRKANLADESLIAPGALRNNKKNAFQKKVKEVHKASTAARRVHNMEMFPWVLEDDETSLNWESAIAPPKAGIDKLREHHQSGKLKEMVEARTNQASESGNGQVKSEGEGGSNGIVKEEQDSIMRTEDSRGQAPWIGKLEGDAENSTSSYALFVFDDRKQGAFRLVPVSRHYKFMQKPKHSKLTADEAEREFERSQKIEMDRWSMRPTSSTGPKVKSEKSEEGSTNAMSFPGGGGGGSRDRLRQVLASASSSSSRGSGRRLLSVRGRDQGGSDDEGGRRRKDDDTFGELDYEEDWADDEERMEGDNALDEEEVKEMEEKLKREMAQAERAAEEDDDEEMNEDDQLTGTGKQMKKIMKALGKATGNDAYEDHEERNPYASESEDDSDMEAITNPERALQKAREAKEQREKEAAREAAANAKLQGKAPGSGTSTPAEEKSAASKPSHKPSTSISIKKRGTHTPGAGHASVAQRATSPPRTSGAPRPSSSSAASPSNSKGGSRGGSKNGSRSSSPVGEGGSPTSAGQKRKSTSSNHNSGSGESSKRAKTGSGSGSGSTSPNRASSPLASPLPASPTLKQPSNAIERELIRMVKSGEATNIKACLAVFGSQLKSGEISKTDFTQAFKEVLTQGPDKTLRVKDGY